MRIKKTTASVIIIYFLGLIIVLCAPLVLPEKYYFDSWTIQSLINESSSDSVLFDSYSNTAVIYRVIGFESYLPSWMAGVLGFSTVFLFTTIAIRPLIRRWHWVPYTAWAVWCIPMAIYAGQYSKEPLAFAVAASLLLLSGTNRGLVTGVLLLILYALFFRIYWIFVTTLFLFNLFVIRNRSSLLVLIASMLGFAALMFSVVDTTTGKFLSDWRLIANDGRMDDIYSVTAFMNPFLNNSVIADIGNSIYGWLTILMPVRLLALFAPQHVLFVIFQCVNVGLFAFAASAVLKHARAIAWFEGVILKRKLEAAVAWVLAYSFVQGIFEPDYGSVARHQIVLVPMLILLLGWWTTRACSFSRDDRHYVHNKRANVN